MAVAGVYFAMKMREASERVTNLPTLIDSIRLEPSVIVANDGTVLYRVSQEYRKPVNYDEIPQVVKDATIAAEDKRFFEHSGIDYFAWGRVLFDSASEGRVTGGASTLTMQIAKRLYTSPARSIDRKVEDMALAIMIERKLTKEQILELYLNQVFYGEGAFGIQAAADVYFGKTLDDLTLGEAALLARLVRRPSRENPFANLDKAIENRNLVLRIMRDEDMITTAEFEAAIAEPVELRERRFGSGARRLQAPYFVDAVLSELEDLGIDISEGGYRVETTLDPAMQRITEREVERTVRDHARNRVSTAAFLLMDRRGEIKAMVGGVSYNRNQFNGVTQGRRQPGSAFKPFVYAVAFQSNAWSPTKAVSNGPLTYQPRYPGGPSWTVRNASNRYGGMVSPLTAMAWSYNVAAVRVMEAVGPARVANFCRTNFGFTSELDPVLPLALGATAVSPLEMARGYSVFMLGGDRVEPMMIRRIVNPQGDIIRSFQPTYARNMLARHVAADIDYMLREVVVNGTGSRARNVVNARGKTGTTSDNRDAWFCGYTDELIGIGWVANEQPGANGGWVYPPMAPGAYGGTVTVTMWAPIMAEAQKRLGEKPREFIKPASMGRTTVAPEHEDMTSDVEPPSTIQDEFESLPPIRSGGTDPSTVVPPPTEPVNPPVETGNRRSEESQVQVDICAESGEIANFYCPEVRRRYLPAASAPRSVCHLHGPGGT